MGLDGAPFLGRFMYPHRIRLRGPWEATVLDGPADTGATRRVTLPARWGALGIGDTGGWIRLRRRFGLPRWIDDWERVWLTCAGVAGQATWRLNDTAIRLANSSEAQLELDITPILRERNDLVVEMEHTGPEGGPWGEVALEIRCRAYLSGVKMNAKRAEDGLRVNIGGQVVTEELADPLELYVLINGANQAYERHHAIRAVSDFQFSLICEPPKTGNPLDVRVDLVNGATIWHTVERTVAVD